MNINSLTFLYLFLPAALVVFNLTPKTFKNTVLAFISITFLVLSQPGNAVFFIFDILLQFIISEAMFKNFEKEKTKKFLLIFSIIFNSAVIIVFSVSNQLTGGFAPFAAMVISFTAIGYFVDFYKKEAAPIRSLPDFVVFLAFFGKLARGPLVRAKDIKYFCEDRSFSLVETGNGLYLFIRGLAKYVVLAIPLVQLHEKLFIANSEEISVIGAWLDMVVFSMMIFFDLSGFCDMARGLGKCFGMDLPKNFYFPFQSPSVSDFLDRFNMTVTGFFRHYIYDVLRNDKNSKPQFIVNTLLICMLCGIWFGIEMNFIIWGFYIAVFIIIEELFLRRFLLEIPHFFARIYTFAITMFSMVIFSASGTNSIVSSYKAMFGINAPMLTDSVSYIISQNMLVLIVGAFFMISAFSMFVHYLNRKSSVLFSVFAVVESAVLLILITAELI
ncbi:MAG: hypothetical protein IJA05_01310 [Oscillospiraceae bacterium]|nr:hypothetical protein [Oscillospiraceae bacterium]